MNHILIDSTGAATTRLTSSFSSKRHTQRRRLHREWEKTGRVWHHKERLVVHRRGAGGGGGGEEKSRVENEESTLS